MRFFCFCFDRRERNIGRKEKIAIKPKVWWFLPSHYQPWLHLINSFFFSSRPCDVQLDGFKWFAHTQTAQTLRLKTAMAHVFRGFIGVINSAVEMTTRACTILQENYIWLHCTLSQHLSKWLTHKSYMLIISASHPASWTCFDFSSSFSWSLVTGIVLNSRRIIY